MTHPLDICRGCDQPMFKCDCVGIEHRRAKAAEAKNARLAALCRTLIDQMWGAWPEYPVVRAEAELREITGG